MYPPGVTWLFCGERACPALGCEAAPKAVIRIYLEKRGALDGAASRPGAGQARSPQKPAHHKKSVHHYAGAPSPKIIPLQKTCHRVTECIQPGVTWLFCGERACPALGGEAAPKAVIRIYLEKRGALDGAASRPGAGQARSPQKPAHHKKSVHHYAGAPSPKIIPLQKTCHRVTECIQPGVTWLFCGERACPALGGEAAPKAVIRIYLEKRGALDGAALRPGAGQARSPQKPAHHKKSVHHYAGAPSPKIIPLQKTCHRVTECIQPGVTWLFCGERACPAPGCEAAPKAVIRIYLEKRGALDGAASRPGAGQARSPQKPAHHKKSVHHYAGAPSPKIIPLQKTCHRVTECIQPGVTWLLW
ncbi:hypothetical protein [Pseudomonas marginalis]|uniref:hypothetical protein n=1 Tax=Pseudomonas marginalis TaxID=298 RepID=UPI00127CEA39|nr:hypothetical protein [Pseudomonas marginalis]KAA8555275.1 hypothetical protein FX984_01902 [Pseudomonas marginalis]